MTPEQLRETFKNREAIVVDDDPASGRLLATVLRELGCVQPQVYTDPRAALKALDARPTDVIYTDWEMHPMNGGAFIKALRESRNAQIAQTAVIVYTGHGVKRVVDAALRAGADQFLVKPLVPMQLIQKTSHVMRKRAAKSAPTLRPRALGRASALRTGGDDEVWEV
ncbi:MAG: response regulator [Maricaulaceae bacterium]